MAETLGEKLRQAREKRGITLSEVAEQTRISSLYLECIENDDYRSLPGGIFNKGFVKSFAKYVGLNEQEAIADYSLLIAASEDRDEGDLKVYKPQVLINDGPGGSMIPTVIAAVVILGLMTAGVLFLVNYLRRPAEPLAANTAPKTNTNTNTAPANTDTSLPGAPGMGAVKIEFKVGNQPVRLAATSDGTKSDNVVAAGSSATFEPKESLTLNYNRWNAPVVQLLINAKEIKLPTEPLDNPKAQRIEFTINKDNLARIWTTASITGEIAPAVTDANANTAPAASQATPAARPTSTPKPAAPANVGAANSNTAKPAIRTQPTPKPTIITVPPKPTPNP